MEGELCLSPLNWFKSGSFSGVERLPAVLHRQDIPRACAHVGIGQPTSPRDTKALDLTLSLYRTVTTHSNLQFDAKIGLVLR